MQTGIQPSARFAMPTGPKSCRGVTRGASVMGQSSRGGARRQWLAWNLVDYGRAHDRRPKHKSN
jgi:hypothetical protein